MVTDMTKGSPVRILWKFSIPLLVSMMFQQLYNIADSVIAGKFVGEEALAAVGASYPIVMIFMAVAVGSNIGSSVIISQSFGAKKYGVMKTAVNTAVVSIAVLSLILTAAGLLYSKSMLLILKTPENIMSTAEEYLNVYTAGLFFLFLYNISTGVFTALGDSKTPLYFLIASSLGNIALDLVFVINFKMGVAGVAWATFIAQGIAALLAFFVLMSRLSKIESGEEKPRLFDTNLLRKTALVAVPSILQQSFVSVGNLFIQALINGFGSSAVAGYSAAIKLNTFVITSISTLAGGLSSYTAQNIGAGKLGRIPKGTRVGMTMTAVVAVPFTIIYAFFGGRALSLFLNNESAGAAAVGISFLRIVSPFYFIVGIKIMMDSVLRGAGAMLTFTISTFADLLLRVVLAFIMSDFVGTDGIWWSWPVGWCVSTVLSVVFYFCGTWRKKAI